jgi:hypothetical protein
MKNLRQIIHACIISIAIIPSASCTSIKTPLLEESLVSELGSQTTQLLNDPELKSLYQEYFPNGKFELSYKERNKKLFLKPNIKEDSSSLYLGFEIKY